MTSILRAVFLRQHSKILLSYISDRAFSVKLDEAHSELKETQAGVQQDSVLGQVLYSIYTRDIPELPFYKVVTFADDTAILDIPDDLEESCKYPFIKD